MDAVLYKLLTHDKQARLFLIDNTAMLGGAHASLSGAALSIFSSALTFTCLLHGILTNAKRVTVKLESSEPAVYMVFGADANGDIQGFASEELIHRQYDGLKDMLGDNGCIRIVYDNGADAVFTGIVEIKEDDIAENLSRYFMQSEQTETIFRHFFECRALHIQLSRGVLVQALPFADSLLIQGWAERLESESGVINDSRQSVETLIETVFSGASVAEKWPVRLNCSCDRQSVLLMLMGLGASELEWTINEDKAIEVRCGKCGKSYGFGADEIKSLIGLIEKEG